MAARKGPKGAAFIEAIFTGTDLARRGGPVRRQRSTILANASLAAVFAAAKARGWNVAEIGFYWYFSDASLPARRVTGIAPSGLLEFAP